MANCPDSFNSRACVLLVEREESTLFQHGLKQQSRLSGLKLRNRLGGIFWPMHRLLNSKRRLREQVEFVEHLESRTIQSQPVERSTHECPPREEVSYK